MSAAIIKQGAHAHSVARIRSLSRDATEQLVDAMPLQSPLQQEVERLGAELEESRRLIEETKVAHKAALDAAREDGFQDGLAQESRNDEEALALLSKAVDDAVAKVDEKLAGTERLAALMARECLDRIFGDDESRTHLLHEIIAQQLRQLEQGSVIAVSLCSEDFPELDSLAVLEPIAGQTVRFTHRAELKRGEIAIDLTLGSLSVGLDQQWGRLRAALTELAEDEG